MSTDQSEQLLGLSEVADLLGTTRQAVGNWRQRRKDFPAPLADLRSGPIWSSASVIDWAKKEGIEVSAVGEVGKPAAGQQRAGTTVALMNMKGGVGKSTLAANLGWYCAYKKDWRVLLVDLDPQFNLSQYVLGTRGYEKHIEDEKKTVRDIFEGGPGRQNGNSELDPSEVISEIQRWDDGSGVDLIPSSLGLSFTLRNPTEKELLLSNFLDQVRGEYDLVLVDCPPTDSILTTAAYAAADSILIPVKPEFLSTIGLPLLVSSLEHFEGVYKKSVDVWGLFSTLRPRSWSMTARAHLSGRSPVRRNGMCSRTRSRTRTHTPRAPGSASRYSLRTMPVAGRLRTSTASAMSSTHA